MKKMNTADEVNVQQNVISIFGNDNENNKPYLIIGEDQVVERIRRKLKTNKKTKFSQWLIDRNPSTYKSVFHENVTWSASFIGGRTDETLASMSKLLAIGLINLTAEQINSFHTQLVSDKYTRILYRSPSESGLRVVVEINCEKLDEFHLYFDWLSIHYHNIYDILTNNIDPKGRSIYQLSHLAYDPEVYYNPSSDCVVLQELIDQEKISIDKGYQLELNKQDNITSTFTDSDIIEGTEPINLITELDPIYYQEKLPNIQKHCLETFLQIVGDRYNLAITIQATTNWNQTNRSFKLNYYLVKNKKKIDCVEFEHDVHLDTTIVSDKKERTNKPKKQMPRANAEDLCKSLLTVLAQSELEQKDVQLTLAKMHTCSYETIRKSMRKVFNKPFLNRDISGKTTVLVKRKKGFKHFLSLNISN